MRKNWMFRIAVFVGLFFLFGCGSASSSSESTTADDTTEPTADEGNTAAADESTPTGDRRPTLSRAKKAEGGTSAGGLTAVEKAAADKHNLQPIGPINRKEMQLPQTLNDANWGMKRNMCEKGDYKLEAYAGQTVTLTSFDIQQTYENEGLMAWIIVKDDQVVCVYKSVRPGSTLSPGVFPATD